MVGSYNNVEFLYTKIDKIIGIDIYGKDHTKEWFVVYCTHIQSDNTCVYNNARINRRFK